MIDFFNKFNIKKYLSYYNLKIIFLNIKILYYFNYLNNIEKNNFLYYLIKIKKNILKYNYNNYNNYIKNSLLKYNKKIGFKIFFFNFLNDKNLFIKLILLKEIEQLNLFTIFIRKIFIKISEKTINIIFPIINNNKITDITTLSYFIMYWNDIIKNNHIYLLFCKKKINTYSFLNYFFKNNIFKNIICKKILNFKYFNYNYLEYKNFDFLILFNNFLLLYLLNLINIINKITIWNSNYLKFIKLKISNVFLITIKNNIKKIFLNVIFLFNLIKIKNVLEKKIFENVFFLKKILNIFRKILLIIFFNKKNIYLFCLKNYFNYKELFYYLIKKKISLKKSLIIFLNCLKYLKRKKISLYNITLKELNQISLIFKKDFFYKLSLENFLLNKYNYFNYNKMIKYINKSKYLLNNIILKFKL